VVRVGRCRSEDARILAHPAVAVASACGRLPWSPGARRPRRAPVAPWPARRASLAAATPRCRPPAPLRYGPRRSRDPGGVIGRGTRSLLRTLPQQLRNRRPTRSPAGRSQRCPQIGRRYRYERCPAAGRPDAPSSRDRPARGATRRPHTLSPPRGCARPSPDSGSVKLGARARARVRRARPRLPPRRPHLGRLAEGTEQVAEGALEEPMRAWPWSERSLMSLPEAPRA